MNLKAVETTMTMARSVWTRLLTYLLVSLLVVCLLTASINRASAQLCQCAEPGWMYCDLLGHHSHEPATAAFPECQVHPRRTAPQRRQRETPQRRERVAPEQREPGSAQVAPPPIESQFKVGELTLANQIKPLNCPRGFARIGQTFYGGTRCASVLPSPAAGEQLPWEAPPESPASPRTQASKPERPPQTQPKSDEAAPKQSSEPTQTAADRTGNAEADRERARDNWGPILDYFKSRKAEKSISTDTGAGLFSHPRENFPWGHNVVWPR